MACHCIHVLLNSFTLLQHDRCYHDSRPSQHPLHPGILGPRLVRVLRFTSFVPEGRKSHGITRASSLKRVPTLDFSISDPIRFTMFQLIHMPYEVPSLRGKPRTLGARSGPAVNVSMTYPHLRKLEEPLMNDLVQILESIVAIPSRGQQRRLGATMSLGFREPLARIV